MRILKYIFIILIFAGLGALAFFWFTGERKSSDNQANLSDEASIVDQCYARFGPPEASGGQDKYVLRMSFSGSRVIGEANFSPREKDSRRGKFRGSISPREKNTTLQEANLLWSVFAEGMSTQEELKIMFDANTASVGHGEMVPGDGVYAYKDPANISYDLSLSRVPCAELDLREDIEAYLRGSITALSPVDAVLGGTWYVVSVNINPSDDTGTVVYEDGHIQEKRGFIYTKNEEGEFIDLIIQE